MFFWNDQATTSTTSKIEPDNIYIFNDNELLGALTMCFQVYTNKIKVLNASQIEIHGLLTKR